MPPSISSKVATALLVSVFIFLVAVVMPKFLFSGVIPSLMTTQGLELFLALLAILIFGKGRFAEYGFCKPKVDLNSQKGKSRWILISLIAPLLGIAATLSILGLGGRGNPLVKQLSIPQMILFVWIFSSVIEEVFTRGFLQGHLSVLAGRYLNLKIVRVEMPVLISALFFGCMHFVLLFVGVDVVTMVVVFLFTFSLGLLAGYLRQKTGSLIPAIVAHMLANIGGLLGGIIFAIINFIITGEMPKM